MRRHMTLTLSAVATLAAGAWVAPAAAGAAAPLTNTIVINPSNGCGLLTAYSAGTVWPASSGPAPSCGAGALTLAFNQGNTSPAPFSGVRAAGSAMLAWSAAGVPRGARMGYQISAPPGMTIRWVDYDASRLQNIADGHGWIGFTYSNSRTAPVHSNGTAVDAAASGPLNTPYWGIELRCVQSTCVWPGEIQLSQITVVAQETQGPSITPVADPGSLWDQTEQWIWNPPGDPWPLPVAAADPSGICSLRAQAGTGPPISDSLPSQTNSSWQECQQPASWTAAVDTNTYVTGAGQLPVTLEATNAAGLPNAMSETLNVDNSPVSVSLTTPNDPNPTLWVNHAVNIDATPSTGPSGLSGEDCSVNGAAAQSYPATGLTVDGDGVKTVSCTAWNNAVDPQGDHNTGTSSVTIHLDEAPPVLGLEPVNPNDPTAVVADTSDGESGVAGGSIEMAPAGTNSWTALPTSFTGTQLVTHFDDAGLRGSYAFKVQACDNVGNCTSTTRTLALPARAQALSEVSLEQISALRCLATPKHTHTSARAPRTFHGASDAGQIGSSGLAASSDIAGAPVRARRIAVSVLEGRTLGGGAWEQLVRSTSLPRPRARAAAVVMRRDQAPQLRCSSSTPKLVDRATVAFGQPVRVHGLLESSAGMPLANQPVTVLTAPDNGSNVLSAAATVTTGPNGRWTATLPPGPSRIIEASYPGSPTVLPASGSATVITPAKIELFRVTPNRAPWGSTVKITGRVLGGYIPASSKLLRLDLGVVGLPGLSKIQGIPNVSPDGRFTTTYKFARAYGVVRFWLMVSSLPEADFPFAPAHSRRVVVTVGVPRATSRSASHPSPRK
jgi:hypothetical protein